MPDYCYAYLLQAEAKITRRRLRNREQIQEVSCPYIGTVTVIKMTTN